MPKTLLLKIVVYACISVCYYSHSILHAQNGYVLSEDAIESFDLMVQANYCWPLSATYSVRLYFYNENEFCLHQ